MYILPFEKQRQQNLKYCFGCVDAEEFTNKMKDLCGDKSKGDGFYHGLWKISDCSHNLTVYPGKDKFMMISNKTYK